ncbi:MAG: hypothetical protein SOX56_02970 [[Pasteurella] mairii]|nr:hypothetical protein [[Pasteurella] mairii]
MLFLTSLFQRIKRYFKKSSMDKKRPARFSKKAWFYHQNEKPTLATQLYCLLGGMDV